MARRQWWMVALAAAGTAQAAQAQDPEIVVTGHGLPDAPALPAYDSQLLDAERLSTAPSGRVEDVLGMVAGFQQFRRSDSRSSNPSAQGATLRALGGNAASRTLVLLDGVPMADPMFGSVPYSALVPARLASIRVTRGGGSGAFGAGAVAGTIAMDSAGAEAGLLNAEASVNQRGETSLEGSIAPRIGRGFVVASAQWDRGQGFWTTPEAQRVPASARAGFNSWSTALRGVAPLGPDMEVQARALVFDDQRTLRFVGADSRSRGEDASIRLIGRGRWQIDALAYLQARDFSNEVVSASTFRRTLNQRATPSTGWGGKFELRPPLGAGQVARLGADWRAARGDLVEDSYSAAFGTYLGTRRAGGRNDDLGLFAEDDWTLGHLVLTGGLRADRWRILHGYQRSTILSTFPPVGPASERQDWALSGRGGAVWHVAPTFSLRASAYSSIRQPTLNELYRTYNVVTTTVLANPALGNERLVGYEGGVDWAPAHWLTLSATGFSNTVRHAIANVSMGISLQTRQNLNAIRAAGVEAQAAVKLGQVRLDASLAWTDAVVEAPGTALDGHRPAQTPRLAASASASWRLRWLGREGWLLSASLRHTGAQYEDDLSTWTLPAATVLGAVAEVPLGRGASLVLRGENLTDTDVVTRLQKSVLGTDSTDLGTPRTLWIGIRVKQ